MLKETTGPRSRFGKCMIKGMAYYLGNEPDKIPITLKTLYESFQAGGFESPIKASLLYRDTAEGILDHLQSKLPSATINKHRDYVKGLVGEPPITVQVSEPEKVQVSTPTGDDWNWIDDETVTGSGLAEPVKASLEISLLHRELMKFVERVEERWKVEDPIFLARSKTNLSVLFIATNIGIPKGTKVKINVLGTIGSNTIPDLGKEYLFCEDGVPLKHSHDYSDGRTYFGWAFQILNGTVIKLWMSKATGYDEIRGRDIWKKCRTVRIRLDESLPKGYQLLSNTIED